MQIAILGATGVFGRHLLPRLVSAGHHVRALVRTPSTASWASACGVDVVPADIFDEASMASALSGCTLAINLATSLPSPASQAGDYAKNDVLRREGTVNWVRACKGAGVARVLQQSIAMVHAGGGDAWADESTFHPSGDTGVAGAAAAAALSMESTIKDSGLDWVILRGALFYGPGTGFDDDWFVRAKAGKLRLPGDGADHVSLVHVADMAAAAMAAVERWPSRQALIVADDHPAPWRDVFGYVCAAAQAPDPQPGGRQLMPSFRVSNRRAKVALDWAPRYPDFRAGLVR